MFLNADFFFYDCFHLPFLKDQSSHYMLSTLHFVMIHLITVLPRNIKLGMLSIYCQLEHFFYVDK